MFTQGSSEAAVAVGRGEPYRQSSCGYLGAGSGKVFAVAVVIAIATTGSWTISPSDFVARDAGRSQYDPYYGASSCFDQPLEYITLSEGNNRGGVLMFKVPRAEKHIWIDYRNFDGTVIATWLLY